jgi:hypothetical protein
MSSSHHSQHAKFPLGQIVVTSGARGAIQQAGISPNTLLDRHVRGDWGIVHTGDEGLNDEALLTGGDIHSVYILSTQVTIWIITQWDRSVTTILLPNEY